jgi:hypothetical protein
MIEDTSRKRILGAFWKAFLKAIFPAAGKCSDAFSPDQECLIRWYKIDFANSEFCFGLSDSHRYSLPIAIGSRWEGA